MLLTGTYEIEESFMDKIHILTTRRGAFKINDPHKEEKLKYEIRLNHKRTLGGMQFRHGIERYPTAYNFLSLPEKKVDFIPEKGNICY